MNRLLTSLRKRPALSDESITILIPTGGRADVLPEALATCLAQEDAGGSTTFLISDNASDDHTPDVVAAAMASDSRVRAIRAPHRLGMAEHWAFALDHVDEGWVMILGDDDGLLPHALPNLRWAISGHRDLEAISWPYSFFCYPDELQPATSGLLALGWQPREEVRSGLGWLKRLADFRSAYYTDLPLAYHGLLHTRLLNRIRRAVGQPIGTRIPDVFLAVAAAAACGRYLRLTESQSLFGSSRHSIGAASQGAGDEAIYRHFEAATRAGIDVGIPRLRSISSMVLEAILVCRTVGLAPRALPIDVVTALTRVCLENAALPQPAHAGVIEALGRLLGRVDVVHAWQRMSSVERDELQRALNETGYMPLHVHREHLDPTRVPSIRQAVGVAAAWYARRREEPVPRDIFFRKRVTDAVSCVGRWAWHPLG
jgi:hypothetical protein